jgi:hypothetical protein
LRIANRDNRLRGREAADAQVSAIGDVAVRRPAYRQEGRIGRNLETWTGWLTHLTACASSQQAAKKQRKNSSHDIPLSVAILKMLVKSGVPS